MAISIDEKQAKFLERKPLIFLIYLLLAGLLFLYGQMTYERKDNKEEIARLNGIILQISKEQSSTLREQINIYKELNKDFDPDKYYENRLRHNRNTDTPNDGR